MFGRSAHHGSDKPTGGEQMGVIWGAVDTAMGLLGQSGEQSPQLSAGAFGALTGTLTGVH